MERREQHSGCVHGVFYKIRPGETLCAVAAKHQISLGDLLLANPYVEPRRIVPGQVIILPIRREGA